MRAIWGMILVSVCAGLSCLGVFPLQAQAQAHAQADTARVNLLNRMATSLRESDHDMALAYSRDALELAKKLNYSRGQGMALGNMGWIYYRKSDFVKALEYSIEAIKMAEAIGDKAELGRSLNNMAAVYFEQKQFDKALTEFSKALAVAEQLDDVRLKARTLNNLAYMYLMGNKQLDSASVYADRALQASEQLRDSYLTSFALRTLGDVWTAKGKYREGVQLYQRGIAMSEKNKNTSMKAATAHRLAKAYIALDRLAEATALLQANERVAIDMGYPEELERTYEVLAELSHRRGDNARAYDYLKKYTTLHDSIYAEKSSEQIALLQGQFDLNLKQAEIELLTKDAALKQEEISTQRMQLYITILTASCALLLVILLLYGFQKSKRVNRELQKQKEELAVKNAEIEDKRQELARLNATKDKLFSIIGHDFRSPLNSLKGLLNLIGNKSMSQQEFEYFSGDLRRKIDAIYDNLDNVLNWSVSQLKGIQANPTVIQPFALTEEVFDLYQEMARTKGVELINSINPDITAFADKEQIRLVLRNLIGNAIKFTSARGFVRLAADWEEDMVQISVEDSGIGMSTDDMQRLFVKDSLWSIQGTQNEKGLGLGLLLCKEFIEKNQGSLTVSSEQGVGTTFRFTLPVSNGKGGEGDVGTYVPGQLARSLV
ncbi:MAG: tetratricopeptide repeat-containing sensor histidine kinase [Bacteroidota bacterium]